MKLKAWTNNLIMSVNEMPFLLKVSPSASKYASRHGNMFLGTRRRYFAGVSEICLRFSLKISKKFRIFHIHFFFQHAQQGFKTGARGSRNPLFVTSSPKTWSNASIQLSAVCVLLHYFAWNVSTVFIHHSVDRKEVTNGLRKCSEFTVSWKTRLQLLFMH
jgi:hypothetical protein